MDSRLRGNDGGAWQWRWSMGMRVADDNHALGRIIAYYNTVDNGTRLQQRQVPFSDVSCYTSDFSRIVPMWRYWLLSVAAVFVLAACGQKGPLYLPEPSTAKVATE